MQLVHPQVPNPIEVPADAVREYALSGWRPVNAGKDWQPPEPPAERLPEGYAVIYHPGLDRTEAVPGIAVWHYRTAGWLLHSEWEANQAASKGGVKAAKPAVSEEK